MSKVLSVMLLSLISTSLYAQDEICGIWLNQDQQTKIEITRTNDTYTGTIVWLKRPTDKHGEPLRDKKNPDRSLRDRPIMGLELLTGITYTQAHWEGDIYTPKRGKTLSVELNLPKQDELQLNVSYLGMTRNQTWTRSE